MASFVKFKKLKRGVFMIKRTNKISANKAMISKEEDGLVVYTFDKDGVEESRTPMSEFAEEFLDKQYISITIGYDVNL